MFGNILNLQQLRPQTDPVSRKILPNLQQDGRTPLAGLLISDVIPLYDYDYE
jgi:hypothetical protein